MSPKFKTNQQGQGVLGFLILVSVIFVGFVYMQLQIGTLINRAFVKSNGSVSSASILPTQSIVVKKYRKPAPTDSTPWGMAQKIGEHTYTIKLGQDAQMGTPQEILEALNIYRQTKGKGTLEWNDTLAHYAQERANTFKTIKSTDAHKGLNDYLDNQDGFVKLGFNRIGENSYYGGPLLGVHVIEWLFASSVEHNANQLDSDWSYAGVGVTNTSVNIIFGGSKM